MSLKAVLFDLDGVIADTAVFHFEAWKRVASKLDIDLPDEFEEQLKGVDRTGSLERILQFGDVHLDENMFEQILVEKNEDYLELIKSLKPENALGGIPKLFDELSKYDIKIVIASASKNAPVILERLELMKYVEAIANPEHVVAGKPAPGIFLEANRLSGVSKEECLCIEDALAGVQSIKSAGMVAISIGDIEGADYTLKSTDELTIEYLLSIKI